MPNHMSATPQTPDPTRVGNGELERKNEVWEPRHQESSLKAKSDERKSHRRQVTVSKKSPSHFSVSQLDDPAVIDGLINRAMGASAAPFISTFPPRRVTPLYPAPVSPWVFGASAHPSVSVDTATHKAESTIVHHDVAHDASQVEAPVTFKAYMACAFAAFGGIFFGYDIGYIAGVMGMPFFISRFTGLPIPGPNASQAQLDAFHLPEWMQSLITSILSAGTFFGALAAGDIADYFGRRTTIIMGCFIFMIGIILQTASVDYKLLVAGRAVSGVGVGFESAIVILYMSEIAPRKIRGALVSGYQFCITIGLLLANCVNYATQNRMDTGSYRIPIAIQFLWAMILGGGLFLLPESPRYFVKSGRPDRAREALIRIRGKENAMYVDAELNEIVANYEYESSLIPAGSYLASWGACFSGGLRKPNSNLRLTLLGTSLQMMQQLTGINFIFYFGTVFFQSLGTIQNAFLISLITTLVNVLSTPVSFWTIERFGRRPLLIWGALGMLICEFIVGIIGTAKPNDTTIAKVQIAFICIYIFFFASTWGPGAWVLIGEIYPIPIRSRGVAMSTASNWLWNCLIAVITPYMVGKEEGNLGSKVFFIWGGLCCTCFVYAYLFVWETKGLTLEQIDHMMEEVGSPRRSAGWVPHTTFAERRENPKMEGARTETV